MVSKCEVEFSIGGSPNHELRLFLLSVDRARVVHVPENCGKDI